MFSRRDASADRTSTTDSQQTMPTPPPVENVMPSTPTVSAPAPAASTRTSDESLIASDDSFDGQLKTTRGVRVMGRVTGSIESQQYVHIEENAHVEADITAEEVVIAGEYSGKLNCRQRVEIRSTGKVSGTLETAKLLLHEGGYFDGELHMQKPSAEATAPVASTAASEDRPRRTRYVDLSSESSREVGAATDAS